MAITISDVLKLQKLKEFKIIAGNEGTGRHVSSIGIMDSFQLVQENMGNFSNISLQDKLILSIFFASYSEESQIECLRFLYNCGASGLVVYQSDLVDGNVKQSVLSLADSLSFPIIQAPEQYYEYSEIISDIMQAVAVCTMPLEPILQYMTQASNGSHTMDSFLHVITNTTGLYVALFDWNMKLIYSSVPDDIFDDTLTGSIRQASRGSFIRHGNTCYYWRERLSRSKDLISYGCIISVGHPTNDVLCRQILDLIQIIAIKFSKQKTMHESLGRALLDGDILLAKYCAKQLGIDIEDFQFLVMCKLASDFQPGEVCKLAVSLEQFFIKNKLLPTVESSDYEIAILFRSTASESELIDMLDKYYAAQKGALSHCDFQFFIFPLESSADVNACYTLFNKNNEHILRIFPRRSVFDHQQIIFAKSIIEMVYSGNNLSIQEILSPLESSCAARLDLFETLATYILDANGNVELSASLLSLHKSTVKYRLRRANELLNCDVCRMPAQCYLYVALAVQRLITQ